MEWLGEAGRVNSPGTGYMSIPISVAVPRSTPGEAVHLIVVAWATTGTGAASGMSDDAAPDPAYGDMYGAGNQYHTLGVAFGGVMRVDTWLAPILWPLDVGDHVAIAWSAFADSGAVAYAVKGIAAGPGYWPDPDGVSPIAASQILGSSSTPSPIDVEDGLFLGVSVRTGAVEVGTGTPIGPDPAWTTPSDTTLAGSQYVYGGSKNWVHYKFISAGTLSPDLDHPSGADGAALAPASGVGPAEPQVVSLAALI